VAIDRLTGSLASVVAMTTANVPEINSFTAEAIDTRHYQGLIQHRLGPHYIYITPVSERESISSRRVD